ncbi:PorV/PorQ family protein [candidate division GN15 bacterium]|nr:PorV/PorQ family protein [candidate division GN15 bacterium]
MLRRSLSIFCLLLATVCLPIWSVSAADINSSAGTSAFSFLKINQAARPVSMGGAFTGVADDEASLYYNPAGLVNFENTRYILGYHNYFVEMQSGLVGVVKPLDEDKAIGFHASYLNYGEFIETDRLGNETGTFGGGDLLLAGTFAMRRNYQFSMGVTAKFIYEKIQDYSATGVALDVGLRYQSNRGRYVGGIMVQNLGTQLSALGEGDKDPLPTILRAGVSARPKGLPMILAGDVILPFDNDLDFAFGAEYVELRPMLIRVGWNSFGSNYKVEDGDNGLAGLALGVGFEYGTMQLSYAFTPAADLGDSHRITLTGGF